MAMSRAHFTVAVLSFRRDDRGVTAVLFALMAVPLLGLTLMAIDIGRAHYARNKMQSAVDSAVGAAAPMLGMPREAIGETVLAYLKANATPGRPLPPYEVIIAPNDTSITVRMTDHIATTVAGLVGVFQLDLKVEATAERPAPVVVPAPEELIPIASAPLDIPVALDRAPTPAEMRDAEAAVRAALEDIERNGGGGEIRELLRALRARR